MVLVDDVPSGSWWCSTGLSAWASPVCVWAGPVYSLQAASRNYYSGMWLQFSLLEKTKLTKLD